MNKKTLFHSSLKWLILLSFLFIQNIGSTQGFLRQSGKKIVDGNGNNFLIRSIGTGNWMIQEGYMMKTEGFLGTQHEIRNKMVQTMGQAKTDSFYNAWLEYHFTRTDVDSMKVWGFNTIRAVLHYNLFTPPIEEEPVPGQITWRDKGFIMLDSLIKWCAENEMYVIIDMHATPGGQGKNADICDYDPKKLALWESQANKDKLVALWKKLAQRYKDEPWVGGYDLINETNWTFSESNNKPLWDIFKVITTAIREVDTTHMIILEGNGFANDYSGLPTLWDDNMVLSFHKYWSGTDEHSLDWMLTLRDQRNVPLWLGESGENSNTWFTDLIALCESKNIGWSWWPVKKSGINNVQNSEFPKAYENLIKYWKGEISKAPTEEEAFQAVLEWAVNHKIENTTIQYDVIDAMMRQPHTDGVIPFKQHKLNEPIFFSDFDLGKYEIAYFDTDIAHYGGTYTAWNSGWGLRNDGVDVEVCTDAGVTNGYNVGWTNNGEWMQYTLNSDSLAAYTLEIRHASGSSGSKIHIEVNDVDISGPLLLPGTGGWQKWSTNFFEGLIIPAGEIKIKFVFDQGGSNVNYFNFKNPIPVTEIDFVMVSAETSIAGDEIFVALNKETTTPVNEINLSDFELKVGMVPMEILEISKQVSSTVLVLQPAEKYYFNSSLTLSYNGTSVKSGSQDLIPFTNKTVKNNLPKRQIIPGKIQAEDFYFNNGLELETCTDAGGGKNTSYAANGDYLDYLVWVNATGTYQFDFRVACTSASRQLTVQLAEETPVVSLGTITFTNTGGWQTWQTQSINLPLTEGEHKLRLYVKQGEFNLNWFNTKLYTGVEEESSNNSISFYPNPANDMLNLKFSDVNWMNSSIEVIDMQGRIVLTQKIESEAQVIIVENLNAGIYCIKISNGPKNYVDRFIKE